MPVEHVRTFVKTLTHAVETMQWGANLVYWAGDKAIGGKMFALMNLENVDARDGDRVHPVLSFYAGPERAAELLEIDGVVPAPYLARAHWVALAYWGVVNRTELEALLTRAYEGVFERLPARTRATLALPKQARARAIAEGRARREAAEAKAKVRKSGQTDMQKLSATAKPLKGTSAKHPAAPATGLRSSAKRRPR